jgi:hypothetical protein
MDADDNLVESRLIDVGRGRRIDGGVSEKRLRGPQARVLGYVVAERMPEQVRMDVGRYARSQGYVLDCAPDRLRRAWRVRVLSPARVVWRVAAPAASTERGNGSRRIGRRYGLFGCTPRSQARPILSLSWRLRRG